MKKVYTNMGVESGRWVYGHLLGSFFQPFCFSKYSSTQIWRRIAGIGTWTWHNQTRLEGAGEERFVSSPCGRASHPGALRRRPPEPRCCLTRPACSPWPSGPCRCQVWGRKSQARRRLCGCSLCRGDWSRTPAWLRPKAWASPHTTPPSNQQVLRGT